MGLLLFDSISRFIRPFIGADSAKAANFQSMPARPIETHPIDGRAAFVEEIGWRIRSSGEPVGIFNKRAIRRSACVAPT